MDTHAFKVTRTDAEWRAKLTPEQYQVMRNHGTERPGSCALLYEKRAGTFSCAGCDSPLFESKLKFESGTGWPSFNDPVPGSVENTDRPQPMAWCAPSAIAPPAAAIWGMCSPMVRRRPGCATASMAWR